MTSGVRSFSAVASRSLLFLQRRRNNTVPSNPLIIAANSRLPFTHHHHRIQCKSITCTRTIRRMSSNASSSLSSTSLSFPVAASIRQKLTSAFQPTHLDVINESHMHSVPKNSETHFKVVVVSSQFDTITSPLQRHRLINAALEEELNNGPVHALSIVAKSPKQWEESNQRIPPSPACRGGDGSLPKKTKEEEQA